MPDVADRNIVFYAVENVDGKSAFDRLAATRGVNDLDEAVWVVEAHDIKMGLIVDQVGDDVKPTRCRFLRIRDDRPYVISPDRQLSLIEIEENHRVTEFTHVILWRDGYLGARASRDAPPIKYLSTYFAAVAQEHCEIVNLYASDVIQRLKEMKGRGLKKVQIKVRTATAMQLEQDEKLKWFKPFFVAGRETEAVTVDIGLSVDRARNKTLESGLGDATERLASYGDLVERLIVTGKDAQGNTQVINLKEQRIALPFPYSDAQSNDDAYATIEAARRQVTDTTRGGSPLDKAARG
jgi:hypothetical protein